MDQPPLEALPGLSLPLLRGEEHPCPYLPDRQASELYLLTTQIDAAMYQYLMDRGFRRSSDVFYIPRCGTCQACVPIRVPVADFAPSRSQRRVWRRNADVEVDYGPVQDDDEHWELYARYQDSQHDREMLDTRENFTAFLCRSPIPTVELSFRLKGRLIGAAIVDVCPESLSSVYFYFDPDEHRRSLGVFSGLHEIAACRRLGMPHWYLGYMIEGCRKMEYKTRFRPYELWDPRHGWQPGDSGA